MAIARLVLPKSRPKENFLSEKPIPHDVTGSITHPPTSMGPDPKMPTVMFERDPITRSRDTLNSRLP